MGGTDLAALITASIGVLGALGGGIRFVWNKLEKRFAAIEAELAECRQREARGSARRSVQLTVIELLWQEVERLAPNGSKVLVRAKRLLEGLKDDLDTHGDEA
jgi:hypothetical protein